MCFRKVQSIADLHSALIYLLNQLPRRRAPDETYFTEAIAGFANGSMAQRKLNLTAEFSASLHSSPLSPKNKETAFFIATCARLLDRFENPHRGNDFRSDWDEFSDDYRRAAPPIRSALMNGFEQARLHAVVSDAIYPTISDRTTYSATQVLPPLIELARSLTAGERVEIAKADYGADVDQQVEGLNRLLDTPDCRFPKGESWFPLEVIELISHQPENAGFIGCTALVLINAIYDGDFREHSSSRWKAHSSVYQNLEMSARGAILSGFRHIYETIEGWDPYWDHFETDSFVVDSMIPPTIDLHVQSAG